MILAAMSAKETGDKVSIYSCFSRQTLVIKSHVMTLLVVRRQAPSVAPYCLYTGRVEVRI